MDVGGWLRGLGLGQYETNFRDNKIDADLLPQLTDAGLKDIGVSALGDRLRLLGAIAALPSAKPLANAPWYVTVSGLQALAMNSLPETVSIRIPRIARCRGLLLPLAVGQRLSGDIGRARAP